VNYPALSLRSKALFEDHQIAIFKQTDRMFAYLMVLQWIAAILTAFIVSPRSWYGTINEVHIHVWTAIFLGGAISAYPLFFALRHPGETYTRHVIAVAQMLWSAILIHLTGGRIETHFHVFGSLAFLSFYRDWKVLIPATIVIAADHFIRGTFWPQSVFGVLNASPWRWIEHAWWVLFENTFLFISCRRSIKEMWNIAENTAKLEITKQIIEAEVEERTKELQLANQQLQAEIHTREMAERELKETQTQLVESEKTATVARLAAGAAHEVKNPLAIIRQGVDFLSSEGSSEEDKKVKASVLGDMSNAINRADGIIHSLLDVSSQSKFNPTQADINNVINQALILTKNQLDKKQIQAIKELAKNLPSLQLDKDRLIHVFINLINNAVDAMNIGGTLRLKTYIKPNDPSLAPFLKDVEDSKQIVTVEILDSGSGIPEDVLDHIFDPFFTTKRKIGGVGLGLSIVRNIIQMHSGCIQIKNRSDAQGVRVLIYFPVKENKDKKEAA